jgi:tRNA threonylcarbamoyladenosine biosynthesis protein TsaB
LACGTEKEVIAAFPVDHRIDDAELMTHVEGVLKKAGWSYADLTHLACVIGPGGFTSLRVGVALANALGHQLKIPLTGVHLSDLYRARMENGKWTLRQAQGENSYWLHSTKKSELFIRGKEFTEPTLITLDDLQKMNVGAWMGELIPEQQKLVEHTSQVELQPVSEILPKFLSRQSFNHGILQPWYGRGW